MIATIIQYLIATACLLFVVSLPLGKSSAGSTLRRVAAVLFLLALMPSVFYGVIQHGQQTPESAGSAHNIGCSIGTLIGIAILSLLAYAAIEIRKRIGRPSKDAWSEYINLRSTGKTAVRPQKQSRRSGVSPILDQDDDD